ncbi:MAG: TPM domain-containing protein [Clostridiales bacterium]|nr:TPM domain-containing protein [Clostridiales bacterium]
MKKLLSVCIALALALCSWAFAASLLEKSKDFYYNDAADVLEYEAKAEIYFNNKNLEKATGSQIVVTTVKSTGSLTRDIYADRLFNSWGVGDKKKDNGFLLLMVIARNPDDGDYWVSQGSGTNAIIDPGEIGDYLDIYLEPDFAKGRYSDGAREIFRVLFEHVRDYYGLNLAYLNYAAIEESGLLGSEDSGFTAERGAKKESKSGTSLIWIAIIAIVIIVIVSRSRRKRQSETVISPTTVVTPPVTPIVVAPQPPRPRTFRTGYYHAPGQIFSRTPSRPSSSGFGGFLNSLGRSMSSASRSSSSGYSSHSSSSRSYSSPSRSSSSRPSSFGGGSGGGGRTSGGGAGRRK